MNIPFIQKKKRVSLARLREKYPLPKRDWAVLLLSLFVGVVIISLYSTYLFFSLFRDDASTSLSGVSLENHPSIDPTLLNQAVQFIDSRKGD